MVEAPQSKKKRVMLPVEAPQSQVEKGDAEGEAPHSKKKRVMLRLKHLSLNRGGRC